MNVLQKIVADKREELEVLKQEMPLESFKYDLVPTEKDLFTSLDQESATFILECKKASPSKGLIREHFDLEEILDAYIPEAAAISVLTDKKYFQGSFEYLEYVTQRVKQPVLNKDFFVDPYQVYLARKYGADAILLMLSVLDDDEYKALERVADRYNLAIITEVSNEVEARRAVELGAKIIGINNRNLRDLSTDLATTERLLPIVTEENHQYAVIISESGIYTHDDVRRLAPMVQSFLVGSSLMAQPDLKQAIQKLLYATVKVCGMTQIEDVQKVKDLGATYAGLIFAPKSKRCISLETALEIVNDVDLQYVGVFVDEDIAKVLDYATALNLTAVQLHGKEDQDYINQLREQLPENIAIWKAKGVKDELPVCNEENVDLFLLDSVSRKLFGGTGKPFDWRILNGLYHKQRFGLAGGISPKNLRRAGQQRLHLIDINSGVESAPGIKDHQKLEDAFKELRKY